MQNPLVSLFAGVIAGTVEGFITYPTEYVKTQLQLQNNLKQKRFNGPVDCLVKTVGNQGIRGLFQAGVRFLTFDQFKEIFKVDGKVTGGGMLLAGLLAGVTEGVLVVTPFETIKTKLIHDQNGAKRYNGMVHGSRLIIKEEGIRGIYKGVSAVVLRQGANSAVRMTTYGLIRDSLASGYPVDAKGKPIVPWYLNFAIGGFAGTVTVYATMPLDVVKTRMQSLDSLQYKNTLDCLVKVVRKEGIFALWKGATPRLGRLIFSGGIVFSVYESVISLVG